MRKCDECKKRIKKGELYQVYGFFPNYGYYHPECVEKLTQEGIALYPWRWNEIDGERQPDPPNIFEKYDALLRVARATAKLRTAALEDDLVNIPKYVKECDDALKEVEHLLE